MHQNRFTGALIVPASVTSLAAFRNSFSSPFIILGNTSLDRCDVYSNEPEDVYEKNCFSNKTCPLCDSISKDDVVTGCTRRNDHSQCLNMFGLSTSTTTATTTATTTTTTTSTTGTTQTLSLLTKPKTTTTNTMTTISSEISTPILLETPQTTSLSNQSTSTKQTISLNSQSTSMTTTLNLIIVIF